MLKIFDNFRCSWKLMISTFTSTWNYSIRLIHRWGITANVSVGTISTCFPMKYSHQKNTKLYEWGYLLFIRCEWQIIQYKMKCIRMYNIILLLDHSEWHMKRHLFRCANGPAQKWSLFDHFWSFFLRSISYSTKLVFAGFS